MTMALISCPFKLLYNKKEIQDRKKSLYGGNCALMWNNSIISKPTIQTVQGRFIEKVALIWLDTILIII